MGGDDASVPDFSESSADGKGAGPSRLSPIPTKYMGQIKESEGFSKRAKWDYKQHTNGFGTRAKYPGEVIDEEEAERRFQDEISKAANLVDDFAPGLPQGVGAALTSLTFNAGPDWQRMGLGAAIKTGDFEDAGRRFNEYTKADGQDLSGLIDRRAKEYQWWFDSAGDTSGADTDGPSQLADLLALPPDKRQAMLLDQIEKTTGADVSGYRRKDQPEAPAAEPLDFSEFAVDPKTDAKTPMSFGQSFGRGVDQMQQMLYGADEATCEATGSDTLTKLGPEGRIANAAEIQQAGEMSKFSNISGVGDFFQWLKETVGEQIPIMAPSAGGAAAGVGGGFLVGGPLGATVGGILGAFVPSLALGTGETQTSIKEKDPNAVAPGYAFAGGTAIAALDSILPGKVGSGLVRKFGAEAAEEIAKRTLTKEVKEGAVKRTVKGVATGMAVEGVTEALQEAIGEYAASSATNQNINWPSLKEQMIEAGAAGAFMGGIASGAEAAVPPAKSDGQPPPIPGQPGPEAPAAPGAPAAATPPPLPEDAPSPAGVPRAARTIAPEDRAALNEQGWTDSDIDEMGDEELAQTVLDAKDQTAPGQTKPKQAPVEDKPSAEPVADLKAQIEAMRAGERKGVYLSAANLENLKSNPNFVAEISKAIQSAGGEVVSGGKGGVLVAANPEVAKSVEAALESGAGPQAVIGELTGSGTGKPAGGSAVVQQKTADGAVTRESLVTPDQIKATEQAFAAPGKTVETVSPEQAIARREDLIAAEKGGQTFKTAKGSTYSVQSDGTTIRNKALRNDVGHEGDQGVKPKSERTVYVSADDANRLGEFQAQGGGKRGLSFTKDGKMIGVQYRDGKDAGKIERRTAVPFQTEPAVGLLPVEMWKDGSVVHFGNEIVEVGQTEPQGDGSRAAPVQIASAEDVVRAGSKVSEPTPAQAEAGNYQKGHVRFQGLPISIETPKGGTRRGVKDGETQWEVPNMPAAYGYIRGSKGADGEQVDVFIGDSVNSDRVFLIDQVDPDTSAFDEHKAVLGADNATQAAELYSGSFSDGKGMSRIGGMSGMSMAEFKAWAKGGEQTAPVSQNVSTAPDFSSLAVQPERMERPTRPERYEGPELSTAEIDALVNSWSYVQDVTRRGRPQSPWAFIMERGGLQDDAKEVRHIAGAAKERPGLVNAGGETLDDAALAAWEAGFFTGSERPDIAEFLDKLQNDLQTGDVVRSTDEEQLEDIRIASDLATEIADYGITTNWFRTEASLREYFGQERPRAAGKDQADEKAQSPASERESGAGQDPVVEEAPFDLPVKAAPSEPEFNPYAFSVQVAFAKEGADGLRKKLAPLSAAALKQIISAQNLAVSTDVFEAGKKKPLTEAIIAAAKDKLANRMAAGGGTVEGAKPAEAKAQAKTPDVAEAKPEKPAAPEGKPLKQIPIILSIEVTDGDGEVTVRMNAEEAISMVDRRIKGLNQLLGCLSK